MMAIEVWFYIVFGGIPISLILVMGVILFRTLRAERYILKRGETAKATVYHSEYDYNMYSCSIKYLDSNNVEQLAILKLKEKLPVGRNIEIKYIPGMQDAVVLTNPDVDAVDIPIPAV